MDGKHAISGLVRSWLIDLAASSSWALPRGYEGPVKLRYAHSVIHTHKMAEH